MIEVVDTEEKIHERAEEPRHLQQHALCRCGACGIVTRCEPGFDFYGEPGDPLICERCFRESLRGRGVDVDGAEARGTLPKIEEPS